MLRFVKMQRQSNTFGLIVLVLMGIWHLPASVDADDCSFWSLGDCLTAFTLNRIDVYHLDDDVPFWNESYDQVKTRCRAYVIFSTCMERVTPHCNSSVQLALQGLNNAFQFLCSEESIRDYVSNQSCYARQDTKDTVTFCNRTYMSKMSTISNNKNIASSYCRYVDDYLDCITAGVTSNCGSKAAKWQSDWIRNLRQPFMQLNQCPGWVTEQDSNNVWATALMIALALTTTLMIIGILSLIIFIARKRMEQRHLRRSLDGASNGSIDSESAPLPPPYSIVVETPGPDGNIQTHLVDSQSSTPQEDSGTFRTLCAASEPYKLPILPPPYCERSGESAPAYSTISTEAAGQLNSGFLEDEGSEKAKASGKITLRETTDTILASDA